MSSTITIRTEWYEMIQNLSTEGKAELLDAIYKYNIGEHGSLKDNSVKLIRPGIQKYYEELKKRRNEKPVSTDKKIYLKFVKLTDEEYNSLVNTFGKNGADTRIRKLNDYIGYKGKKYQSHYYTILNRSRKETTNTSEKDKIREMQRKMRLENAREILSNNNSGDGQSIQNTEFNRRAGV